jgi:hypothetical protein
MRSNLPEQLRTNAIRCGTCPAGLDLEHKAGKWSVERPSDAGDVGRALAKERCRSCVEQLADAEVRQRRTEEHRRRLGRENALTSSWRPPLPEASSSLAWVDLALLSGGSAASTSSSGASVRPCRAGEADVARIPPVDHARKSPAKPTGQVTGVARCRAVLDLIE